MYTLNPLVIRTLCLFARSYALNVKLRKIVHKKVIFVVTCKKNLSSQRRMFIGSNVTKAGMIVATISISLHMNIVLQQKFQNIK